MRVFTCENCGGNEFFERNGYRVCSYCSSEYPLDDKDTSQKSDDNNSVLFQLKRLLDVCCEFDSESVMRCPVCRGESMLLDAASRFWECSNCRYSISDNKLQSGYVYWFCDGCDDYLNVQPGFEYNATSWICTKCGYFNDTSRSNMIED